MMGHYDENRKYDEEQQQRANGLYQVAPGQWESILRPQLEVERDTVRLRVEHLTTRTFVRWTDSLKWILDTLNTDIERPDGVAKLAASFDDIADFISTYPHPVGTFYLIATLRDAVKIIQDNPTRDIRVLLLPSE